MAEVSRSHLDRSGLLAAPAEERQDLLGDYLCGLVASACGTGTEEAADAPLLALGVDAYAVVSIQHSIETDLGVHLTVSDLAHAASIRLLAARLDERIGAGTTPAEVDVLAPVPPSGQAAPEKDVVRLYCWVGGSRVPGQAALSSDPVLCRDGRGLEGTTAMGFVKQSVAVQ